MRSWMLLKMLDMPQAQWPTYVQMSACRARSDPDGVDRTDQATVAQHRGVGHLVEDVGVDPQAPQRCHHHDGSRALATVSDLERYGPPVVQAHGIDALGAVLGDQARDATHQG